MRIPDGDLAPARRRRRRGGFGRRRRSPLRRALPLLVVVAVVAAGALGLQRLRADDPRQPQRVVAQESPCPTPTAAAPPRLVLPAPSAVRLRLLNGTPRDGLGKAVGDELARRGFVVTATDNAARPVAGASRVYHGSGAAAAAQAVAVHVIGAELVPVATAPRGAVDLVLGTGFTRVRTAAEAQEFTARVLRRANAAATPSAAPGCA